jgi:hypothetical protein
MPDLKVRSPGSVFERLWIWGPAVAQMAAIFFLSSMATLPSLPGGLTSYTGHVIGYAILGACVLRALARATWQGVTTRTAWWAWVWSAAYGATDEIHQRFVPGRTATVDDWIADAVGAAIAIGALLIWRRAVWPASTRAV